MQFENEIPRETLSLSDLVKGSRQLQMLTPADDAEIAAFFDRAAMGSKFRLLMQRKPRFHDLFDQRGGVSRVFGMRDYDGKLIGTGALTSTPCFINGEPGRFGYMADLRIQTHDRSLKEEWRGLFGRILKYGPTSKEMGENGRMVAVIIETNHRAIRLLKESTHNGQRLFPLAPYSMVTIFKRLPWFRKKSVDFKAEHFAGKGEAGIHELESFLESVHKRQAFGQCFGAPHYELRRRLQVWENFSVQDFYVVRDRAGKIVASAALWNPNHCKQSVVEGPWWTGLFNIFARALRIPQFGRPMEILYLTHLSLSWDLSPEEREEVFGLLVSKLWPERRKRNAEAIAFCDFKEFSLAGGLRGYIKAPVKVGMYLVMPEEELATFDRNTLGKFPPSFELALV